MPKMTRKSPMPTYVTEFQHVMDDLGLDSESTHDVEFLSFLFHFCSIACKSRGPAKTAAVLRGTADHIEKHGGMESAPKPKGQH